MLGEMRTLWNRKPELVLVNPDPDPDPDIMKAVMWKRISIVWKQKLSRSL